MCLEEDSWRLLLHDHLGQCGQAAVPPCSLPVAFIEHRHDICALPVITFPSCHDLSTVMENSLAVVLIVFFSALGCILYCLRTCHMPSLLLWSLTHNFLYCDSVLPHILLLASRSWELSEQRFRVKWSKKGITCLDLLHVPGTRSPLSLTAVGPYLPHSFFHGQCIYRVSCSLHNPG